jgi:hypothetical protein
MQLWLGARRDAPDTAVGLPPDALLRHALALGSSGSGKTVFCKVLAEEAIRAGVPVIAVDPQGDLASLALRAEEDSGPIGAELMERIDPVLFTPASRRGVPLCADPVNSDLARLEPIERAHAVTRTAARIASLLGYDLDSDDGAGLSAVIDQAMTEMLEAGRTPASLRDVIEVLEADPERFARYLAARRIRAATQRAARLEVGARRLLFHEGVPIDIDLLLGRRPEAAPPPGKTRVSIIYLNTLHGQEDKEFFVGALADRLHAWMLAHPSPSLQAVFFVDEVAPFIPPVRKPACKEDLAILYKQARKFGVGCIAATQNPGDLDYKAMGQFGTWALGRLATRQDLKKVEPALRALVPDAADLIEALPSLRPGELVLVSPDHFDAPCPLATRRLVTPHRTIDEDGVSALSAAMRERFAPLELAPPPEPTAFDPVPPPVPAERDEIEWPHEIEWPEERPRDGTVIEEAIPTAAYGTVIEEAHPTTAYEAIPTTAYAISTVEVTDSQILAEQPAEDPGLARIARALASRATMTAAELAEKAGVGEKKARAALKTLVAAGRAGHFKDGRRILYFATERGARPDLGMKAKVTSVVPQIDRDGAEALAREQARTKLLGLLGENEAFEDAHLVYRPLYRVAFEEKVKRSLIGRIVGPTHDERAGSIYLHPRTLDVLLFSRDDGIRFTSEPGEYASAVEDLDGAAEFHELPPGAIAFDEEDWKGRREPADVKKRFRQVFGARPTSVTPIFVPLWKLILRREAGDSYRLVTLDALVGRPVDWP